MSLTIEVGHSAPFCFMFECETKKRRCKTKLSSARHTASYVRLKLESVRFFQVQSKNQSYTSQQRFSSDERESCLSGGSQVACAPPSVDADSRSACPALPRARAHARAAAASYRSFRALCRVLMCLSPLLIAALS